MIFRENTAFQIDARDNVATALSDLAPGRVDLLGDGLEKSITTLEPIPKGHKLALRDIRPGEDVVKYGVSIGRAHTAITCGAWVHLHCMGSKFDEKSNSLDPVTGTSKETTYS